MSLNDLDDAAATDDTAEPPVLVSRRGTLGVLTMNRPKERNPLDPVSASALLSAMQDLLADDEVRSVVLEGRGEAFCAGGNLRQMGRFRALTTQEAYSWPEAIVELHRLMLSAAKPVLAAVDGPAVAGGMGLAGMCDIVLATRRSSFAMPEARIGMFPMIIVAHLVRSVPRKVLLEMVMTGDPLAAQDAHRLGFVNHLYDDRAALDAGVDALAARLALASPMSIRLGRRAFSLLADLPASAALDAAQFLNLPFFLGADLEEGVAAFFEKRSPAWHPTDQYPADGHPEVRP